MGIEPTLSAWEAEVLPLNYTRPEPFGMDARLPRGDAIHPSGRLFPNLSSDRSPRGSQHSFELGRSLQPLSLPLQKSLRFFRDPLPAYDIDLPYGMSCLIRIRHRIRLSTFRTRNRVERIPPFRRWSSISVCRPSNDTTDHIPFWAGPIRCFGPFKLYDV
jgi:hypothetical protein